MTTNESWQETKMFESMLRGLKPKLVDLVAIAKSEFMDSPLDGEIFTFFLYLDTYGGNVKNWSKVITPFMKDLNAKIKERKPYYPERFQQYRDQLMRLNNTEFFGCIRTLAIDIRVEYPRLISVIQKLNLAMLEEQK